MALPEDPQHPPNWSSDLFRDPAAHAAGVDRGLIGHVPIIAMLLIGQGVLELLFAVLGFGFLALVSFAPQKEFAGMRGLGILMAAVSTPALVSGLLRIVAGIFNLQYRRRVLGIVALAVGLLTMLTAYCAPTSIALAIYGLVVYVNDPVIMAFQMGDSGRPLSEIRSAYLTRR
jgi:uncharacterized membrane protein